jgi:hypothetical protein
MAEQLTSVFTLFFILAQITARVCNVVTIVRWIPYFATKAIIFSWYPYAQIITRRTTPAILRFGAQRPLGDAIQVENVKTLVTTPNWLEWFDLFTAHQALQFASFDFLNEFFTLRTLGGVLYFYSFKVAVHFEVGMSGAAAGRLGFIFSGLFFFERFTVVVVVMILFSVR